MTWLQTYTGRRFEFETPHWSDISIVDIAHALALTNRFGGHTRVPYSVAEHSCRVAMRCRDLAHGNLDAMRAGLLHDAAEAYVGDLVRPLKLRIDMGAFGWLERRIMRVIEVRFAPAAEIDYQHLVVKADAELLATEARDLLNGGPLEGWASLPDPLPERIEAKGELWQAAEIWFLQVWQGLWEADPERSAVEDRLRVLREEVVA